jgi:uncharacterized membrane protein YeaQ/YmgE (transglycosylase-associated protein family)
MNFITWIILGGLAGWIASMILGSDLGLIQNILVGIVGSVIGGGIANLFRLGRSRRFSLIEFIFSVLGSVVLLYLILRFF